MLRPRAGSSSAGMRTSNSACACPRNSYTRTSYSPLRRIFGPTVPPTSSVFGKRSEEHTSELQSLMRISYAVFCLKKKIKTSTNNANKVNRTQYKDNKKTQYRHLNTKH